MKPTDPSPDDGLVACKSCGDWGWQDDGDDVAKCPCRWIGERPCDPLCRCSGGPL